MLPGVRILIDALIMSLPGLSSVFMLIIFAYTVFSVMGVQLFQGSFQYHCIPTAHCAAVGGNTSYLDLGACDTDNDCSTWFNYTNTTVNSTVVCANVTAETKNVSLVYAGEYGFCSPPEIDDVGCEFAGDNFECTEAHEIYHNGATSWDSTPRAVLILFQMTTTEGCPGSS